MSALGSDFSRESFLRTPIHLIQRVLKEIDNHEQAQANIDSVTTARLIDVVLRVAHGFSGSKKKMAKTNISDFLPFPDWMPESKAKTEVDSGTKQVLIALLKKRQIPMHIFTGLVTPPPE